MRILHRYIASSFLTTFFMALLVLSFVMSVGLLFKVTQYIARGMSIDIVLDFLWGGIPGTLSYSIPIACLVATLLVFGRLSSDQEISAMRACGISLARAMGTPLLLALVLSFFCLHLNNTVAPESAYARSTVRRKLKATDVTAFIEEGKYVEIAGRSVYVGERDGNLLKDMRIVETTRTGSVQEIRAREALVTSSDDVVVLEMKDVSIDPIQENNPGIGRAESVRYVIGDFGAHTGRNASIDRPRRIKDKHSWVLLKDILVSRDHPPATEEGKKAISRSLEELHSRVSLAFACFCFVAIGVPLGIQQHRRESSVGIGISLAVAGAFYLFSVAAESLARTPAFKAHYLVWIPVVACLVISVAMTAKNN
ncbi:MAG: LptF/LptG family permease [Kiritimatiellia bacterium]|jgi:lipopolysaccharide export system permease protein